MYSFWLCRPLLLRASFSPVVASGSRPPVVMRRPLLVVASPVAEDGLSGTQASVVRLAASRVWAQYLGHRGLVALGHVGSSHTSD